MARTYYPRDALSTIITASTTLTASDTDGLGTGNVIVDLGSGRLDAVLVFDVSAIDVASTDESYDFIVQGSNSSTFASGIEELARLRLGATATRSGAASSTVGRYSLPFANEKPDGTEYRYSRVLMIAAGTTPSVTVTGMWMSIDRAVGA